MGYKSSLQRFFLTATTSAAMAAIVVAPIGPNAEASEAGFSDVASDVYYTESVQYLAEKNVITGYTDGTFKPGKELTRAEAAKIFVQALGLDTSTAPAPWFTDVKSGDWYAKPISTLVQAGIVNGYPDGTFNPNGTITRAEMAKMLVKAYPDLEAMGKSGVAFTDVEDGEWYSEYVAALVAADITKGDTATTFAPNDIVTRGQAATFVYRSGQAVTVEEAVEEEDVVEGELEAVEDENVSEEEPVEEEEELDELVTLSLDGVLEKALEDNSNLLILSYRQESLNRIETDAERTLDREIEEDLEDLRGSSDPTDRAKRGGLYDARNALLDQLEQLEFQKKQSEIGLEQTKEAVSFGMKARYIQILSLQEQIEFSKVSKKWLESDLAVLQRQNSVGVASEEEVRELEREIEDLESSIKQDEDDLKFELLKLQFDLNLPYSNNVELESIEETEIELIKKPDNIDELVSQSYQMRTAEENMKVLELTLEQQWYDGMAARIQNQTNIDVAKEEMEQQIIDLTKTVNTIYDDAKSLYTAYQDSVRNLSYLEEDQSNLQKRYELGLVSKYDFEKMDRSLKQAEFELAMTELNYFLTVEKVEALQRGFIATQQ